MTECPAPHFITTRLRSLFLENLEYSTFDLRQSDQFDVKVWSGVMTGRILYGRTPLELIAAYTDYAGRMRPLPDWVHQGLIAGLQGGTEVVRGKLATLKDAEVPLAGLWLQDWCGARTTDAGKQLWWDWKLDSGYYPDWQGLSAEVAAAGGRMLVYINPYLCRAARARRALPAGAGGRATWCETGRRHARSSSATRLRRRGRSTSATPAARAWIKGVIKGALIGEAGASGWMNDFGEGLMFDSRLYDGGDPAGLAQPLPRGMGAGQPRGDRGGRARGRHHLLRPLGLHPQPGDRHALLARRPDADLGRVRRHQDRRRRAPLRRRLRVQPQPQRHRRLRGGEGERRRAADPGDRAHAGAPDALDRFAENKNDLRITVQLVNAADGYHLYSESFDFPSEGTADIEQALSQSVTQVLRTWLSPELVRQWQARGPDSREAFGYFVRARAYGHQGTPDGDAQAEELYRLAIERDPQFALAYVGLAEVKLSTLSSRELKLADVSEEVAQLLATAEKLNADMPRADDREGLVGQRTQGL